MEISLASAGAAIVLAAVHALAIGAGESVIAEKVWARRRWVSAAAGVSVAYVFVDVLPELGAHSQVIGEAAGAAGLLFAEQRLYLLALLSFVVMYGLEHMVLTQRQHTGEATASGRPGPAYWLHIAGFSAYSALIGYLLVERADRGIGSIALYTAAMAVHFVIVNHALAEEHGAAYRRHGHWWLAASVLAGWVMAVALPLSELAFARLFAVLAGGVVITSLRSELPDDRRGRFWWFCLAALAFAALLLMA